MSSEQTLSTCDLRAAAQDYKREEQRKHKWALGPKIARGRGDAHPRPMKVHESLATHSRWEKHETVRLDGMAKAKLARKQEMITAGDEYNNNMSEDSNTSAEEDVDAEATAPDAQVMYSFDAYRAPTQGSQILNAALAQAIDKYEDKETTKLVKNEYEILDAEDDEDAIGSTPMKSKAKIVDAEDAEYEFL